MQINDSDAVAAIQEVRELTKFPLNDPELRRSNMYWASLFLAWRVAPLTQEELDNDPAEGHARQLRMAFDSDIRAAINKNWPKE